MHRYAFLVVLAALASASTGFAAPIGSAFTYQGLLRDDGQPASGLYDLQLCLFDDPVSPLPRTCHPDFDDAPVADGAFTLLLDFGPNAFTGELLYLEIRVRPGTGGAYTILTPRQAIRPAPEAVRAAAASAAPWSGLTGVPAGFADGVDDDTNSGGTVTQVAAGPGLAGGPITASGTLSIASAGVQQAMLAPGAVGTGQVQDGAITMAKLADGSVSQSKLLPNIVDSPTIIDESITGFDLAPGAVGLADIDTSQVQARVAGLCAIGQYFRGIATDGALACEPVPGVPRMSLIDDPANDIGLELDIAIGADGVPVLAWYDATNGDLRLGVCADAACTGLASTRTLDAAGDVGSELALAIAADGTPSVAYYEAGTANLKFAKCADPGCGGAVAVQTVISAGSTGLSLDLAIGADGLPVIAYSDDTAVDLRAYLCANASCTSGTSQLVNANLNTSIDFVGVSLAIDGTGRPWIAHPSVVGLQVAICANAACTGTPTLRTIDTPQDTGYRFHDPQLAIASDGFGVVAYKENVALGFSSTVYVAACGNTSCTSAQAVVLGAAAREENLGMALVGGLFPLVASSNTAWSLRSLVSINAGDVVAVAVGRLGGTRDVAVAAGADGLPLIAYGTATSGGSIAVFKCGTRTCY